MYLVGDIGNTEIKIFILKENYNVLKKVVLKTKYITSKSLNKKFKFVKNKKLRISQAIISSVVPRVFKMIKKYLVKNNLKTIELKKKNLKSYINIKVNKKQVGSDRLANAIGISNKKDNFIVIDFGTATTFDVIYKNNYVGGLIAPGIQLSLQTLISHASLIPSTKLSKSSKVLGKNTKSAIQSGFYWGYSGLINNIINIIIKNTKKKFKIVLTGGNAKLFQKAINFNTMIKKDLTIYGLFKVIKNEK